ncbi:XRE family transcriptional regulator [Mesobacillus boroniphilus]|uniref:XRE family transcriptional regulator n=1 Tax=Mesobacillus boroniphilus TaxID=308892 RepID=A0A944GYE5_9BACI|nr:helix-turn-helix transcriptional regulator [Mesobacillus boroniphilus]MBS8265416.1 XRE family transcriptional regulator [Mesobacillus boroniphilus]
MTTPLGQELRRLRRERDLRLEDVANETGITLQYLSMLEKGARKSVSFEIMADISRFYGVPLDYFAAFIKEEESKPLSDVEIMLWQTINEKVRDEIYYKKGKSLKDVFSKMLK